MKPTKLSAIVSYAVASSIIGVFLAEFLVRSGAPIPVSPASLVAVLPFISVSLVVFAWPIFKYRQAVRARLEQVKKDPASATNSPAPKRVDPFYAVRVALLAKVHRHRRRIFQRMARRRLDRTAEFTGPNRRTFLACDFGRRRLDRHGGLRPRG